MASLEQERSEKQELQIKLQKAHADIEKLIQNNHMLYQLVVDNGIEDSVNEGPVKLSPEESKFLTEVVFLETRDEDIELDVDHLADKKQDIQNFFIKSATTLNDAIDDQNSIEEKMNACNDEVEKSKLKEEYQRMDREINAMIKRFKSIFDDEIRYIIQDYIAIGKQEIENIAMEQKELIGWCADLYKSVCIDENEGKSEEQIMKIEP